MSAGWASESECLLKLCILGAWPAHPSAGPRGRVKWRESLVSPRQLQRGSDKNLISTTRGKKVSGEYQAYNIAKNNDHSLTGCKHLSFKVKKKKKIFLQIRVHLYSRYEAEELRFFSSSFLFSFLFQLFPSIPFSPFPSALCDTTEVMALVFFFPFLLPLLPLLITDSEGKKESNICFTAIS